MDRRRFLKLAASAAATAAVTACGAPPTPAPGAPSPQAGAQPANAKPTAAPTQAPVAPATATPAPALKLDTSAQPTATSVGTKPGPSTYKEAPQLAQLVKDGKLPPVEKRLPDNPRVVNVLEEIGQYGGVWHRAYRGLSDRVGPNKLTEETLIEWDAPDTNTIKLVANLVEKWEQSKDGTEFTFYFRKGIKWSDGVELTTDDTRFWWEDVALDKDISPLPSFMVQQKVGSEYKPAELTIVDRYTARVKFPAPNPLLPITIAKQGGGLRASAPLIAPSHYLKKFHPKYAKKEELDKLATDRKLSSWVDLWGKAGTLEGPIAFWFLNPELPVINPWKIDKPTPADPCVMVRNPYYWQVDAAGNQLPYIDAIEHAYYDQNEVFKLWIASGKIDMQMRGLDAGAYTFYKENEAKGGYRTLNWRAGSTDAYHPNVNTPDKVLGKLFDTPDFRQALSLAINRKEINDVVWNGLGRPRQYAPVRGSPEYDEGMEQAWAQYDPKKANELLDGLGLKRGGDGVRVRPDGKPLEVTIEHMSPQGTPGADAHELVKKYWNAIGVRASTKVYERGIYEERDHNAEVEIGGGFVWDSATVCKADPRQWLGTLDDNPWAPAYGHWYDKSPYKKEEPPPDHPIRKIWALWEKTLVEADEAKRNAYFQDIIAVHRETPFAIGTVGEKVQPMIAKNNFRNVKGGYIQNDLLRDYGLINPQQFFFKK
jgi:peptide/nickel transport system substrate-binding protein